MPQKAIGKNTHATLLACASHPSHDTDPPAFIWTPRPALLRCSSASNHPQPMIGASSSCVSWRAWPAHTSIVPSYDEPHPVSRSGALTPFPDAGYRLHMQSADHATRPRMHVRIPFPAVRAPQSTLVTAAIGRPLPWQCRVHCTRSEHVLLACWV